METWHVALGFKAEKPLTEDAPFDLSDRLEDLAAVMSVSRDLHSGSIALTVDAESFTDAIDQARSAFALAMASEEVDHQVVSVTVQTDDEFEAELSEPVYPPVVSFAEIAKLAGVTRQRVRQLAEKATFPNPVIKTGQGPLYSLHAVDRWLENRNPSNRTNHTVTA